MTTGKDAPDVGAPRLTRRRALGAASARSLLLTVLGELVLSTGEPAWTSAFLDVLGALGVEEKAVRQALARSADDGWVEPRRRGRRTAWALTDGGERMLEDGAARIYGFGAPAAPWDGRWLLALVGAPQADRRLRHLLRTRLAWEGMGSLVPGAWVSPHPEREADVTAVLADLGLEAEATVFVGRLGTLGDPARIARTAWDLEALACRYTEFVEGFGSVEVTDPREATAWQLRLVQEWRRFPFLDPRLPPALLPPHWVGTRAAALFAEKHETWKPLADAHWTALTRESSTTSSMRNRS